MTTKRIRVIKVTPSQVKTAQDQVERDRLMKRKSDPAVVQIANARSSASVSTPWSQQRSGRTSDRQVATVETQKDFKPGF